MVGLVDNTGCRPVVGDDPKTETPEQRKACFELAHNNALNTYERAHAYVDITSRLNEAMHTNANTLIEYKDAQGYRSAIDYFITMVQPGGNWDFKSQSDWSLNPETTYIYEDQLLRYDDVGNIHYGYVGRVLFGSYTLQLAGGAVQIYSGTSSWAFWNSKFDDPRDQEMIQYGSMIWDAEHPN